MGCFVLGFCWFGFRFGILCLVCWLGVVFCDLFLGWVFVFSGFGFGCDWWVDGFVELVDLWDLVFDAWCFWVCCCCLFGFCVVLDCLACCFVG